jgi:hypothetical protein
MTLSVGIAGNCQARGIRRAVEAMLPDCRTVWIGDGWIFNVDEAKRQKCADDLAACDVVFMQPWGKQYGPVALEAIRAKKPDVITYPYLGFTGFHPDCTHVRLDGKQMGGGIGPYHSAIIAASFLAGLTEQRAEMLFNAYTYASLGYLDQFEASAKTLLRDTRAHGFDLTEFAELKRGVFMHVINHPAISILQEMAKQGLMRAGVAPGEINTAPHDELAEGAIWPIYPELAKRLKLEGSLNFIRKEESHFSLSEFIAHCYASYGKLGREFTSPSIDRALAFIRQHVQQDISMAA